IPAGENDPPVYVEYDGDLYWVNLNRQRQLFINTREKPRPMFRVVHAARVGPESIEEPAARSRQSEETLSPGNLLETPAPRSETATGPELLPQGPELLAMLRPMMRRGRGGWSGSLGFLSRAVRRRETDLSSALATLGLQLPE